MLTTTFLNKNGTVRLIQHAIGSSRIMNHVSSGKKGLTNFSILPSLISSSFSSSPESVVLTFGINHRYGTNGLLDHKRICRPFSSVADDNDGMMKENKELSSLCDAPIDSTRIRENSRNGGIFRRGLSHYGPSRSFCLPPRKNSSVDDMINNSMDSASSSADINNIDDRNFDASSSSEEFNPMNNNNNNVSVFALMWKGALQEYCHAMSLPQPSYRTEREGGSDHEPRWRCIATVGDVSAKGVAAMKKSVSEDDAAKSLLSALTGDPGSFSMPSLDYAKQSGSHVTPHANNNNNNNSNSTINSLRRDTVSRIDDMMDDVFPSSDGPVLVIIDAENRAEALGYQFPSHVVVHAFASEGWSVPNSARHALGPDVKNGRNDPNHRRNNSNAGNRKNENDQSSKTQIGESSNDDDEGGKSARLHFIPGSVKGPEAADAFVAVWVGKNLEAIKRNNLRVVIVSKDHFFDRVAETLRYFDIKASVNALVPESFVPKTEKIPDLDI